MRRDNASILTFNGDSMNKIKLIGVVATLLFVSTQSVFALDLKLVNKTDRDLHQLFVGPAGSEEWGPDQLGEDVVENGATFTLTEIPKGKYDVLFVDEHGDKCDVRDVDFSSSEEFVMTKSIIKGCQAATAADEEEGEDEEAES